MLTEEAEGDQPDLDVQPDRSQCGAEHATQAARRDHAVLRALGRRGARQLGQTREQRLQRTRQAFADALDLMLQSQGFFQLVDVHKPQRARRAHAVAGYGACPERQIGVVEKAGFHLHAFAAQQPQGVVVELGLGAGAAAIGQVEQVRVELVEQVVQRLRQTLLQRLAQSGLKLGAGLGVDHRLIRSGVPGPTAGPDRSAAPESRRRCGRRGRRLR